MKKHLRCGSIYHYRKQLPFFLLLISCFVLAESQNGLTLQQALQQAQSHSPVLQRQQAILQESAAKVVESESAFLPSLSGNISYLLGKNYMLVDTQLGGSTITIPQIFPTTIDSLNLQWNLFEGFAGVHRRQAALAMESSSKSELQWTHFKLERNIQLLFYKCLSSRILLETANQNLKTLQDHLKDVMATRQAGIATRYDVLRVEVQVSDAESEVTKAENLFENSQYQLAEAMGIEKLSQIPTGVLPPITIDLKLPFEKSSEASSVQRKDILSLQQKVQSLHFESEAFHSHWLPKLSFVGQYNFYNNRNDRFLDQDAFRDSYQMGLQLSWNFFDGFASSAKENAAFQRRLQSEATLRQTELHATQEIQTWQRQWKYFSKVYRTKINDIAKSEEAVRLAQEGRRAGTRTNTELLDAESELFRSRASVIHAQMGALESLIQLELATGQNLFSLTSKE